MVLDLAETLQLPLDARNHLLLSAGFAAVYPDTPPDAAGVELIWVETPPLDPAWDGVRDRLDRAAA